MKLKLLALGLVLLLTGCTMSVSAQQPQVKATPQHAVVKKALVDAEGDVDDGEVIPIAFEPSWGMSAKETIETYIEQQYLSYTSMNYIDISYMLDLDRNNNKNMLSWLQGLAQRRRLIYENNLAYVETGKYPYTIHYIDAGALEDNRMSIWRNAGVIQSDEVIYHFVIKGESDKVYPPMLAINSQQTIRLRQVDGVWKIVSHYFPGSVRKYSKTPSLPSRDEMLRQLQQEFAQVSSSTMTAPEGAVVYDGERAASYARKYIFSSNKSFYRIIDWIGNCANFTSQSIWHGFGGEESTAAVSAKRNMTTQWYAGSGGGTLPWENVNRFWAYATGSNGFHCQVINGVSALKNGDIVQTSSGTDKGSYNHSLIVVDSDTLLLAQNSPACYVYYSDLFNVDARFIRPEYLTHA